MLKNIANYFKYQYKLEDLSPIIFADFLKRGIEPHMRIYEEVKDYNQLLKSIKEYMSQDTKLNLVLFKDAVQHLSRIARVLRQ